MSLTVDAAPPGAPAGPSRGPSAHSLPSGLAALFAALLTGKMQADAATGKAGDAGADGKTPLPDKGERRPDDPIVLPTPDPNILALLVPPTAANMPPAPQIAALNKTTEYKTTENAMDTALSAPAPPEMQKDGGLLFPPQTEQTTALAITAQTTALPINAAPVVTPAALQSVAAPAVLPARQTENTAASAIAPQTFGEASAAVTSSALSFDKAVSTATPLPAGALAPAITPKLTSAVGLSTAIPPIGQATVVTNAPLAQTASPVVTSVPHTSALQIANAVSVAEATVPSPALASAVSPQTVFSVTPQNAPLGNVTGAAKTETTSTLKKSPVPANNTGRGLTAVLPFGATADAAEVTATQVALSEGRPAVDIQEPSEEAGTGPQAEAVPAQASGLMQASALTLQTAHAAPAKTETGTAARQVADELVGLKLAPGAARQVTVNLHPREWGDVRVQVTMAPANADGTAGAVTAHLSADSPQARAALEASSGDLRRALHDAGLRLETLTISATDTVQAASQGAAMGGNGSQPGQDSNQNAFAAFAGTGNGHNSAASGGGQGGSSRQSGQSGPSFLGTADTDNTPARPETPRTNPAKGVDIRA